MKSLIRAALALIGLCSGCSDSAVLTPAQFTHEFAAALVAASPGIKVDVVRDLQLKVTTSDGRESNAFLDNAYDTYKQDPTHRADTMQKFVAATLEASADVRGQVDRTRIVPVVKDRPWLEET